MLIVYIHGNRASADSFNFIRSQLAGYTDLVIQYDSADGFYNNHRKMVAELNERQNIFFVAHSMGGIHALHLANELGEQVLGGVTISTPYGGSESADLLKYMLPFHQVLRDIGPRGAPIVEAQKFEILQPWTNIVTVKGGSPLMATANDGVVTHTSMRNRKDIQLVDVESNHFEVVQTHEAVAIIRNAVEEVQRAQSSASAATTQAAPVKSRG